MKLENLERINALVEELKAVDIQLNNLRTIDCLPKIRLTSLHRGLSFSIPVDQDIAYSMIDRYRLQLVNQLTALGVTL